MRFVVMLALASTLSAQVSYERILRADNEPENWLTYSGGYSSHRYSPLRQINRENAGDLKAIWTHQKDSLHKFETTPLVVDGVMYISEPPSDVTALDANTGRALWKYERQLPTDIPVCCGEVNRGVAVLGDSVYIGTLDAHLVSLDAKTGLVEWDVEVEDYHLGISVTVAPLAVKDKVVVGIAGGEYGVRGFLDAYDAKTGERAWRFWTVPGPGEPGNETWAGDSWKRGSATTWVTGSYDPDLNLVYWGTGNPGPDWNGEVREGDNLYSDSLIALDLDTGKLKWYFQFTPHDVHDWDATEVPVLIDGVVRGASASWCCSPIAMLFITCSTVNRANSCRAKHSRSRLGPKGSTITAARCEFPIPRPLSPERKSTPAFRGRRTGLAPATVRWITCST